MLVVLLALLALGPQETGPAARVIQEIVQGGAYQTRLPGDGTEAFEYESESESERRAGYGPRGGSDRRDRARSSRPLQLPVRPLGMIVKVLFWILVSMLVIWILAYFVRSRSWVRDAGAASEVKGASSTRAAGAPVVSVDQVEELVHAGRFGEALHLLLLSVFRELFQEAGGTIDPALTSRELIRQLSLKGEQQRALQELAMAVEHFLFGAVAPDRRVYERCRHCYDSVRSGTGGEAR
jgi:hypothetical protein